MDEQAILGKNVFFHLWCLNEPGQGPGHFTFKETLVKLGVSFYFLFYHMSEYSTNKILKFNDDYFR